MTFYPLQSACLCCQRFASLVKQELAISTWDNALPDILGPGQAKSAMTIHIKSESYHICGNQLPASKCWHVNAARTLVPLRESVMATNYRSLTSNVAGADVCLYFRNKETTVPLGVGFRDFPSGQLRRSMKLGIIFGSTIRCNVAGLDSTEAKKSFDLLHGFQIVRRLSLDTAQGTLHVFS